MRQKNTLDLVPLTWISWCGTVRSVTMSIIPVMGREGAASVSFFGVPVIWRDEPGLPAW
jgi:hypothetical protein